MTTRDLLAYIYSQAYIHVYIYMYIHIFREAHIYARVWVYTCTRVGAFFYLYRPVSLLYASVCQVFLNTYMRVWGGIGSGVGFSLFMVYACYWRGRLCFGGGRDRGFVLYISLFLWVCVWCVCVVCVCVWCKQAPISFMCPQTCR